MLTKKQALRRFRLAVSLFFFIQGVVFATWTNRIADLKTALHLSDAALGNVLFAIPVGQMLAMYVSAWLINRFCSRRMLTLASVLYPFCLLPPGLADTPYGLAAGLLFFGISGNLFNIAANTQGVNVEHLYARSIMASFHGLWSLGGFLGGVLSMGFIALEVKPWLHFLVMGTVAFLLSGFIRRQLVRNDWHPRKAASTPSTTGQKPLPLSQRIDKYVILLGGMAFCAMVCEGCMYDWSGVYFQQVVHAPGKLVQLGFVICLCTMTVGRFIADHLVSRFGARRVIRGSGLLITFGLAVAVLLPNLWTASIGFFLIGFGISSTVPVCYSMAGRSQQMNPSTALATVSSVSYLGLLLGPPVIGHLSQAITLHWTFAVIALFGLLIAAGASRLHE